MEVTVGFNFLFFNQFVLNVVLERKVCLSDHILHGSHFKSEGDVLIFYRLSVVRVNITRCHETILKVIAICLKKKNEGTGDEPLVISYVNSTNYMVGFSVYSKILFEFLSAD